MAEFLQAIGFFTCLGSVVGLVFYLVWVGTQISEMRQHLNSLQQTLDTE